LPFNHITKKIGVVAVQSIVVQKNWLDHDQEDQIGVKKTNYYVEKAQIKENIFNWAEKCLSNLATLLLALVCICVWEDRFKSECKGKRRSSKEKNISFF
jgi:hypothetical protein